MFDGWKTVLFFSVFLLTAVAGLFGFADWTPTEDMTEIVNIVVAIIALILRFLTTGPVFGGALHRRLGK